MASRIRQRFSTEVGSSTTQASLLKATIATRSFGPHLIDEFGQAGLHHVDLVVFLHGAGDVHDESQRRILALIIWNVLALQADAEQIGAFGAEGRAGGFQVDAEGAFAGVGVFLLEVVDALFDADQIGGRQLAVAQIVAQFGVRGGIDIHGEGGEVVLARVDEGLVGVRICLPRRVGRPRDGRGRAAGFLRGGGGRTGCQHHGVGLSDSASRCGWLRRGLLFCSA